MTPLHGKTIAQELILFYFKKRRLNKLYLRDHMASLVKTTFNETVGIVYSTCMYVGVFQALVCDKTTNYFWL